MDIINFLNRNWIRSLGNVLDRHYYPDYKWVDTTQVTSIKTDFGEFYLSKALQQYPNVFSQVDEYKIDDLRKDDVVLDIGANIGAFTVMVAPKVAQVVAIEPLFTHELDANVKLNNLNNVRCYPLALGYEGTSNILFCGVERAVQTLELNEFRKFIGSKLKPTFLKCDCEGGEWSLKPDDFRGIRAVEAEVHTFGGKDPVKFVKMLEEIGFDCDYYWTKEKQLMVSARR